MKRVTLIVRWLLKVWPLWAAIALIALSMSAFYVLEVDKSIVQKAGILLQSVGAVTVLYSLNKNIGVFKQATLFQRAIRWIRAFPLIKRNVTLEGVGNIQIQSTVGSPSLQQWNENWTPEQKIEELKTRILSCFEEVRRKDKATREKIESVAAELRSEIQKGNRTIAETRLQLESATIGSVNPQIFGVLLAIYGTTLLI